MSVVRVVRAKQYTVISNSPLQDARLSLKARGLLAYCFSLPPDWKYSVEGLVKSIGSDGRDAIRSALKELENCGYLIRRRLHDEKGKLRDTEYIIYETAQVGNEEITPKTTPAEAAESVQTAAQLLDSKETEPRKDQPVLAEPMLDMPALENPALVDIEGGMPITENPILAFPVLEKPVSENRPQKSKYINKKNIKTATRAKKQQAEPEASALPPAEARLLADTCGVSKAALANAVKKFGAAEVTCYLAHMVSRKNIKNPDAWLFRALNEQWEIAGGSAPQPDCPECGGRGYVIYRYTDLATEEEKQIHMKCKCVKR